MTDAPLLSARGLVVGFRGQALLPPIDLDIRPGSFWAVVGRNGSGKSTVLRTLLGLMPPVGGKVVRSAGGRLAYVGQRLHYDDLYPVTAWDVVRMGVLGPDQPLGVDDRLGEALEATGVVGFADRMFRSLSEGQKQRVLLARMVVSGAKVAVLDEPTAAMDRVAEREAMDLLDGLRRRLGMALVVVTHNLAEVRRVADHALLLDPDACIVGSTEAVFGHAAFHAGYGTDEVDRLAGP